jgi:DNA polymerase-1
VSGRNYGLISSYEELIEYTERVHQDIRNGSPFGFDIETGYHGPDREKGSVHPETAILAGISFSSSTDWARYVPLGHNDAENLDNHDAAIIFWDLLQTGMGVAHNAGFELRHLAKWFRQHLSSDPLRGDAVRKSHGYFPVRSDTLVEAYLMAEFERFGLKPLTKALFDHNMTELYELFPDLPVNKRKYLRFNTLELTPKVVDYACEDSVWCLAIHERYWPQVKDRLLYRVEMAIVTEVLWDMEDEGICYDWGLMQRTADELREFRDRYNAEIMGDLTEILGKPTAINLASPKQVADILFDQLGLRTSVYTKGTRDLPPEQRRMSTGDIALQKLAKNHPVVRKILLWRNATKLLGTYLDKYEQQFNFADDGRVHANHLSAFVRTGRFATSTPNYQQSPKKYHLDLAEAIAAHEAGQTAPDGSCFKFNFRDVIVAPPDFYILGFDLSQAELRAIAGEAQEIALLEAFANGEDVHRVTASLMLGIPIDEITDEQRQIGKMLNFALLYGMSAKGLADRLAITLDEAETLMDKYFAGLPGIAAYIQRQQSFGRTNGYVVSKFGRRLPIWEYKSPNPFVQQGGDRACVNYPIQGAATGDYMKIAMVQAIRAIREAGLGDKVRLVMNVHDALEFYVHKSHKPQDVIKLLEPAVIFPVTGWPAMKADWHIAKRWGSPVEIIANPDGTYTAKGEKQYELTPSVEVDDEGEVIEVLPDVSDEALREAVRPQFDAGRQVVLKLGRMPEIPDWRAFVARLKELPGFNTVTVLTPDGTITIPFSCGLRPDHLGKVNTLLRDPGMTIEYAIDTVDELISGLQL